MFCFLCRCKDVCHRRTGDRIRCFGISSLWIDLLALAYDVKRNGGSLLPLLCVLWVVFSQFGLNSIAADFLDRFLLVNGKISADACGFT